MTTTPTSEYERYQPKGSMCMACAKATENCSALDFKSMRLMYSAGAVAIIKCTEFKQPWYMEKVI